MTGISKKIREALAQGPATVRELAHEFEIDPRKVQIGMWVLTHSKQAVSTVHVPTDGGHGARNLKLYELTRRGELLHMRDRLI